MRVADFHGLPRRRPGDDPAHLRRRCFAPTASMATGAERRVLPAGLCQHSHQHDEREDAGDEEDPRVPLDPRTLLVFGFSHGSYLFPRRARCAPGPNRTRSRPERNRRSRASDLPRRETTTGSGDPCRRLRDEVDVRRDRGGPARLPRLDRGVREGACRTAGTDIQCWSARPRPRPRTDLSRISTPCHPVRDTPRDPAPRRRRPASKMRDRAWNAFARQTIPERASRPAASVRTREGPSPPVPRCAQQRSCMLWSPPSPRGEATAGRSRCQVRVFRIFGGQPVGAERRPARQVRQRLTREA
jgi:hypothetical protein